MGRAFARSRHRRREFEIPTSDVFAKSVGGTDRPILAFGRPMELLISGLETRDLLTEEERSVLRALPLQEASFRAGQEIVREGSTPTFSSLLVRGLAARSQILADGSRQICAFHVPGDFVDLHSYLLNEMDHGVQAMSEAQLLQVPHAALRALTDSHPHLARLLWLMTLIDAATHRAWIASIGKVLEQSGWHISSVRCLSAWRLSAWSKHIRLSFPSPQALFSGRTRLLDRPHQPGPPGTSLHRVGEMDWTCGRGPGLARLRELGQVRPPLPQPWAQTPLRAQSGGPLSRWRACPLRPTSTRQSAGRGRSP